MKQFFLEFIGMSVLFIVVACIFCLFVPKDMVSWEEIVFPGIILSAVFCVYKLLENGYGDADYEE